MIQFDEHMFQKGWFNHQPGKGSDVFLLNQWPLFWGDLSFPVFRTEEADPFHFCESKNPLYGSQEARPGIDGSGIPMEGWLWNRIISLST